MLIYLFATVASYLVVYLFREAIVLLLNCPALKEVTGNYLFNVSDL